MKKSQLKQIIKECVAEILSEATAKHGFDLTGITASNWKKVLAAVGVRPAAAQSGITWKWTGPGIQIFTGNDPITGKYSQSGGREDEKDYASYIGIEGDPAKVKMAAGLIKKLAKTIKGESPGEREFI